MGEYTDKIIHINASPEFFKDKEAMDALEKMCKIAYHKKMEIEKPKKKRKRIVRNVAPKPELVFSTAK